MELACGQCNPKINTVRACQIWELDSNVEYEYPLSNIASLLSSVQI